MTSPVKFPALIKEESTARHGSHEHDFPARTRRRRDFDMRASKAEVAPPKLTSSSLGARSKKSPGLAALNSYLPTRSESRLMGHCFRVSLKDCDDIQLSSCLDKYGMLASTLASLGKQQTGDQATEYGVNNAKASAVEVLPSGLLMVNRSNKWNGKCPIKYRRPEIDWTRLKATSYGDFNRILCSSLQNDDNMDVNTNYGDQRRGKKDEFVGTPASKSKIGGKARKSLASAIKTGPIEMCLLEESEDASSKSKKNGPSSKSESTDFSDGLSMFDDEDDFEEVYPYDLSQYDFERQTKPNQPPLNQNQEDYKEFCKMVKVVPSAFIVRSLVQPSMKLESFQLGYRRIKALCCALTTNYFVHSLTISEDDIDKKAIACISDMLIENNFINELDLSNNNLGRFKIKILLDALVDTDRITHLCLSGNRIEDSDGDIFVQYISTTQLLRTLDLSYNALRDQAPTIIGQALAKNSSIEKLELRWNHLQAPGVTNLFNSILKNTTLTSLGLSWNGIGGDGVRALCRVVVKNTALLDLDISSNRIDFKSMLVFFNALTRAISLKSLTVGGNLLTTTNIHELLETIVLNKKEMTLRNLDFGADAIKYETLALVNKCLMNKDILVSHSTVISKVKEYAVISDADLLASFDPLVVLVEFVRVLNTSIIDMFQLEEDSRREFTRQEIKEVLVSHGLELPDTSMELLTRKMDIDGDGSISVGELMSVDHHAKRAQKSKRSTRNVESIRCRKVLRRLLKMDIKSKKKSDTKSRPPERRLSQSSKSDDRSSQIIDHVARGGSNQSFDSKLDFATLMSTAASVPVDGTVYENAAPTTEIDPLVPGVSNITVDTINADGPIENADPRKRGGRRSKTSGKLVKFTKDSIQEGRKKSRNRSKSKLPTTSTEANDPAAEKEEPSVPVATLPLTEDTDEELAPQGMQGPEQQL